MQFFPAAMSNGAQTSKYSGVFETAATRSGQDFSGLFSTHLEQADAASATDRIEQSPPASMQDMADVDVQTRPDRQDDAVEDRERQSAGEEESGLKAFEERHDRQADVDEAQAAKAAVQEESAGHQDHDGHLDSAGVDGEAGEGDKSSASVADDVDDSTVTMATAVLADVSAAVKGQGEGAGEEKIAARIEALQELVRQFQQSESSARSELAVSLGAQLRSLKEELVAWQQGRSERRSSGQNALASSRAVSKAVRHLDELAQRFEVSGMNRQAAQAGNNGRSRSASAQDGASVAMSGKAQARAAAVNVGAAEAGVAAGATLEQQAQSTDSRHASAKQKGELQASQVQAQPRGRGAENKESMLRNAVQVEPVRSSPQPEGSPQEAAAAGTEKAAASRENGRISDTRAASAASAGLAASVGGKNAAPKDKSEHQLPEQLGLNAQEGDPAVRVSVSSAERKGGQNRQDARQGFFGAENQQDKPSVTKAQASGSGKIVLEGESLTGAVAQNSQAQVQQRLNSPVSTRSAEVYKQVESGAFKNLGQGVKQLVIRLDPMELGQVSVILQVRGKEVQAVLRTSNQETSVALNEQLSQLRTQLEAQGLKVGKLEVQTQLADGQDQSQWQGAESHNRYQENREFAMSAKRWRTLDRVSPDLVRDVQNSPQREKLSQSGLDIFA